jgi:hypothetical protein
MSWRHNCGATILAVQVQVTVPVATLRLLLLSTTTRLAITTDWFPMNKLQTMDDTLASFAGFIRGRPTSPEWISARRFQNFPSIKNLLPFTNSTITLACFRDEARTMAIYGLPPCSFCIPSSRNCRVLLRMRLRMRLRLRPSWFQSRMEMIGSCPCSISILSPFVRHHDIHLDQPAMNFISIPSS